MKISEKYLELIHAFPLRPIRNESELKRATKVIEQLMIREEDDLSADEGAYLEVLAGLVEEYEDEHYPMGESTPARMLEFFIDQRDVTQRDVAQKTGIPVSTISELLSEKREFTRNHIERLSEYFHVNPSVFHFYNRKLTPAGA